MSTSPHSILDRERTIAAPVDYEGILNMEASGDDFTGKCEFVAPDNVAIKITIELALMLWTSLRCRTTKPT